MYIVANLYWTILYCDRAIGPIPRYKKWSLIWRLTFLCSAIIEHEFISYVIVVVNLFYIFADIIFINLRMI